LKGGEVLLLQPNKQSVSSEIKEDGSYSFDKVVAGQCKVAVKTSQFKPPTGGARRFNPPPADAQGQHKQSMTPEEMAKRYTAIPENYEDPTTSNKEITVKSGKQEIDINLD
jgi:hypothetical protein